MDKPLQIYLLLFHVFYNVNSYSNQPDACLKPDLCKGISTLNYAPGFEYVYEYEAEIETKLAGVDDDSATVRLNSKCRVAIVSSCQIDLAILNVEISGIDEKASTQLKRQLETSSVRFTVTGSGRVDSICVDEKLPPKATNILRGIVSLFQTSVPSDIHRKRFIRNDVDIFGECPTRYTIQRGWRTTLIDREKNLQNCIRHRQIRHSFKSTSHRPRSLPLVKGQQTCRQVSTNILQHTECEEIHLFRPFSGADGSGAATTIRQKLKFIADVPNSLLIFQTSSKTETRSLVIERLKNSMIVDRQSEVGAEIEELVGELCKATRRDLSPTTLTAFERLSRTMELCSVSQLEEIIGSAENSCPDNPRIKNVLLDALSGVDSVESLSLMSSLVSRDVIPQPIRDSWLDSLGFREHVEPNELSALVPLLTSSMSKHVRLAMSTFVSIYCRSNSSCTEDANVRHFIGILEEKLKSDCTPKDDDEGDEILIALKSMGNLGVGNFDKLVKCATNSIVPLYLRISAIEAHHRFPCSLSRAKIFKLYEQTDNPSELRIVAYLESMRCPTANLVRSIEKILESEPINQVGSFVWTHLTSIRGSSDECKAPIQSLLSSANLKSKFRTDARKFSHFYETSFFSELLDTGIHSESQVIFPTDSYFPRSAMINLTTDIFGKSINLLQFSVRTEGLESLVETVLGPKGLFPVKSGAVHTSTHEKLRVDEQKLRRISQEELSKSRFGRKPRASVSVKFLGNEIRVWSSWGENVLTSLSQIFDLQQLLTTLADERQFRLTRTSKLFDMRVQYPTGVGLSLQASLASTAALDVTAVGRMDLRMLVASRSCVIESQFHPTVAIRLVGGWAIEGIGLELRTTFHSSATIDGRLEKRADELLGIRIDVPSDRVATTSVEHEVIRIDLNGEHKLMGIVSDRVNGEYCSTNLTSRVLGLKFYSEISYPNASRVSSAPYFPLTGPAHIKFYSDKTDPTLITFLGEYRWEKEKLVNSNEKHLHIFVLSFKTPRSSIDREVTAEFIHDQHDRHINVRLLTPYKKVVLNGNYIYEPNLKKIDGTVTINRDKYLVQAEWRRESHPNMMRIIPYLYIRTPTAPVCALSGSLVLQGDKKLTIDLQLEHLTTDVITLKGDVVKSDRHPIRLDWNLALNASILKTLVTGSYQVDADIFVVTCIVRYSWRNSNPEYIELLTKVRKTSLPNNQLSRLTCTSHLQLTAWPHYDTLVAWSFLSAEGHVENTVQLGLGSHAKQEFHQMRFEQIFSYSGNLKRNNLTVLFKFEYPVKNLQMGLVIDHYNQPRNLGTRVTVHTSDSHRICVGLNLTDHTKSLAKLGARFRLEMPNRVINISGDLEEYKLRNYIIICTATWTGGKRVTVLADYVNRSHRKQLYHSIKSNLTATDGRVWFWDGDFIAKENHMHLGNSLETPTRNLYIAWSNVTRTEPGKYWVIGKLKWPEADYTGESNLTFGDEKILQSKVTLEPHTQIVTYAATKIYDDVMRLDLDLMWDAKRNRSQRVKFGGEYRILSSEKSKGSIDFQYPGRNVSGQLVKTQRGIWAIGPLDYDTIASLQWAPDAQMILDVKANRIIQGYRQQRQYQADLRTPFENFETTSVALISVDDAVEWQREVLLKNGNGFRVRANSKVTDILNSRRREGSVEWRSRINGWEKIDLSGWYVKGESQVTGRVNAAWDDDKRVILRVDGVDESTENLSRVYGGFNLTTHWFPNTTLAVKLHHARHDNFVDSTVDVQWPANKKFKVHIVASDVDGKKRGKILVNTPIKGYEEVGVEGNHSVFENSFCTDGAVSWYEGRTTRFGIFARALSVENKINLTAKFSLTTPYEGFDELGTNFRWMSDKNRTELNVGLRWPMSKAFGITLATIRENKIGVERYVVFRTPWTGYEEFSGHVVHKITNSRIMLSASVTKNERSYDIFFRQAVNKMNDTLTTFTLGTRTINYTLFFTFDGVKFEMLTHEQDDGVVKRTGEFSLRRNSERLVGKFWIDTLDIGNWGVKMDVKNKESQIVEIDVRQVYVESNWSHDTRIDYQGKPFLSLLIARPVEGDVRGKFCLSTFAENVSNSCETDDLRINIVVRATEKENSSEYFIQITHPKFPLQLSYVKSDEKGNRTRLHGSVTWDSDNESGLSTAEFDTIWFFGATEKSLNVKFFHPIYRAITFNASYVKTRMKFRQLLQIGWNGNGKLGYEVLSEMQRKGEEKIRRGEVRLIHTTRTAGLRGTLIKDKKTARVKVQMLWDLERDVNKSVSIRLESTNPKMSNYEALIGIQHPSLQKELVVSSTITNSDNPEFRFLVDYSPQTEDLLTIYFKVMNFSSSSTRDFGAMMGIVHDSTGINTMVKIRGWKNSDEMYLETAWRYRDRYDISDEKRIIAHKHAKSVEIQISSNNFKRTINGYINNNKSVCDIRLRQDDSIDLFRAIVDKENWRSHLIVATNTDSHYDIISGFSNDIRRAGLLAMSNATGNPDINTRLELETPYLVVSELTWKTDFLSRFKNFVSGTSTNLIENTQKNWVLMRDEWDDEITYKTEKVGQKLHEFLRPITVHVQSTVQQIKKDVSTVAEEVSTSYDRNVFFVKDVIDWTNVEFGSQFVRISENVQETWNDAIRETERIINKISDAWWEWKARTTNTIDAWCAYANDWIQSKISGFEAQLISFRESWKENLSYNFQLAKEAAIVWYERAKNAASFIGETVRSIWNAISAVGQKISDVWSSIKLFFSDHWHEFKTRFVQSELFVSLRAWAIDFYETCVHVIKHEIYEPLKDLIRSVIRILSEHPLVVAIRKLICRLWSTIKTWVLSVINSPSVIAIRQVIRNVYEKFIWVLDYYELRTGFKSLLLRTYDIYTILTQRRGYQVRVGLDTRNRMLFLPSEGRLHSEQHLPAPWYSLTQIPHFSRLPEVRTIKWVWSLFSTRRTSFWEKYYQYSPYFSPSTWLPPFPAFAIFASDYFYVTFDGIHYAFTGDCVYLLAHDFASGNLSLSVDFRSRSPSDPFNLILLTNGKEVEISSKVSINGKKSELPLTIGDTTIVRIGNVLHIVPARGTALQCHLDFAICWLWMDGWYFGRTAGLLGRYNNEASDDVESLWNTTFPSQWEVGHGTCKSHVNRATLVISDLDEENANDQCWSYFESELSVFKFCFGRVDPVPFHSSCRGDVFLGLGLCRTAVAYVSACNFEGIPLAIPSECVTCASMDDNVMRAGDNITVRKDHMMPSSDIVLIVELRRCNQHIFDKLPDLVDALDQALERYNVTSNRFSLVIYGGNDVYDSPHVRTIDGNIFGSARQFASSWSSYAVTDAGSGVEDAFGALQYSSNLPFRIGVSKIFVALLCVPCERSKNSSVGMDYPEVHRMLLEDGINIHFLLDYDFDIKNSKDFYGLDAKRAFTIKDARARRVMGDLELKHQVPNPKFICVPLALESNGTVFSSNRLTDARAQRKNFLDVFSRRVAESAADAHDCQQCDCVADQYGTGRVHCQPCLFPVPASDHFDFGFLYDSLEEEFGHEEDDEIENRDKQNTKIDKH